MSTGFAALVGRELRMLARSWQIVAVYLVLPVVIAGFTREAFATVALVSGSEASGIEQAVAGQAILFATMLLSQLGYAFYEEQAWGTWDRLRAAPVPLTQVVGAKLAVHWSHQVAQSVALVLVGGTVMGLSIEGSTVAVLAVAAAFGLAVAGAGFLAFVVSASNAQFNIACYLGALVVAGCGGALVPFDLLPSWARAVGPVMPSYWAMRGFEAAVAPGGSVAAVARHCGVLAGTGLALGAVGALAFRPDRRRRSYA